MNSLRENRGCAWCLPFVVWAALWVLELHAQPSAGTSVADEIRIIAIEGTAEIMPAGAQTWVLTVTNQPLHPGDKLRVGERSRLTLQWSDQSIVSVAALTQLEILPPDQPGSLPSLNLIRGMFSFFHRNQPSRIKALIHGATASVEGTEFLARALGPTGGERVLLAVIDGKIRFSNAKGGLTLTNDQEAVIEPGQPPVRTPGFIANNLLQWCFYYPGVLDLKDLNWIRNQPAELTASLKAYGSGDLLEALKNYPASRKPGPDSERIYHAALLLSVGEVEECQSELATLSGDKALEPLAESLRTLISAVKRESIPQTRKPELATELLAASYYEQSRATGEPSLRSALALARRATVVSPEFGFAWERVAELEFGFGRVKEAGLALDKSLELSPRNAQALALKGFLLAAQNHIGTATEWFDRAIAADGSLGNAWLGRGLCRIRSGNTAAGRHDLLVAAALEPQRAILHSYLGKAFADAGRMELADREMARALRLDPSDPTGWLYLALLRQQENRINDAVSDLEKSEELNSNRSVYRSQPLLDQDQAVRSANLASVYRDDGMTDVSVREAAKGVTEDYDNYSAHLFLSQSYDALRDPTRFNLRYETVWFNELLLANLLSPVGGGQLAQNVSQQEYSKLFASDGFGMANSTTVRSDGSYTELVSQYGTFGNTGYAFDLDYQHNDGVRINNELDDIEWYTTLKQQITPSDTAMALIKYEDYHSGDNFQYYNQNEARPYYQFNEHQEPIAIAAWNHEWGPGMHTLLMVGRLGNEQDISDQGANQLLLIQDPFGRIVGHDSEPFGVDYTGKLGIYTAELNQIAQWDRVTVNAGTRFQTGTFDTQTTFTNPPGLVPLVFRSPIDQMSVGAEFERVTGYGYLTVEPLDRLWLTAGATYEDMKYPSNFRNPPLTPGEDHHSQLGPKAAAVWEVMPKMTLRAIYSKSLGGVSLDESYRLEPTELAGFPQTFRTLIPESIAGSVAAPVYEIYGGALDYKFSSRTYAGLEVEQLDSQVDRTIGDYTLVNHLVPYLPGFTAEHLDYQETSVNVSLNQLISDTVSVGASYTYDQVTYKDLLPNVPVAALSTAVQHDHANLQEASVYLLFNFPTGFFARAEVNWYCQNNSGYSPALPGDDFFQENLFAGYRCLNRRLEIEVGILNLMGAGYHLNPLSTYTELPREPVFTTTLKFIF